MISLKNGHNCWFFCVQSIEEGNTFRKFIIYQLQVCHDLLFCSLSTHLVTWFIQTSVFPCKNCQKQKNIEYLKIETPRCTNKNNILSRTQEKILLGTSLPYSVFNGNNCLFLSLLFFFLLLDVGVVPASKEPFLN